MDKKLREAAEVANHPAVRGAPPGRGAARAGHQAAHAAIAMAALMAGSEMLPDLPEERQRPEWETGGHHHSRGKLRKGTKPQVKKWFLVREIHPDKVAMRQAAGQRLVQRADGVWIWPVEDQRRYQREHP